MEDDGDRLMGLAASGKFCLQTALRRTAWYPKEELARVAALVPKDVDGTTPKFDHNAGVAIYISSNNEEPRFLSSHIPPFRCPF